MLTIDNLIGIICLCTTFYSLGYSHGQRDSKTKKIAAPTCQNERLFRLIISANRLSVASFLFIEYHHLAHLSMHYYIV